MQQVQEAGTSPWVQPLMVEIQVPPAWLNLPAAQGAQKVMGSLRKAAKAAAARGSGVRKVACFCIQVQMTRGRSAVTLGAVSCCRF